MSTAIPDATAVLFSASSEPASAVSSTGTVGGQPARRFRKTLIRTGQYTKPEQGLRFGVDGASLDHWVATFSAMRDAGIDVPVPVEHTDDPEANRGYLRELFREGDALVGIVELIGDDAIRLAGRSDVSIFVPPKLEDSQGRTFSQPIAHVALTTKPVIPGLGPFEPLAASRGLPTQTITLSLEGSTMDPVAAPAAQPTADDMNPAESLKKAFRAKAQKLWDDESLDAAGLASAMKDLRKRQEDVLKKLGDDDPTNDPDPNDPSVTGGAGTVSASRPATIAASRTVDPNLVRLMIDNRKLKVEAAMAAGRITAAQGKKLGEMFDVEKLTLTLSRNSEDNFDDVLEAMSLAGGGVKAGEATGPQTMRLSRPDQRSDEPNALVADAERRAKAAAKK